MEFPIEFVKCPNCGCKDTVCRLACADEPSIPKDTFVSLEKVISPFQQSSSIIGPFIKAIVCHYDVCAKCGLRYCTRAEIANVPVQVQQAAGNQLRFDPKSHRRLS